MRQGISIVIDAIAYVGVRGLVYGAGFGAAFGTSIALINGTVYGILLGGMVGFGGAFIGFLLLFSTLSVVREDFRTFVSGLISKG